MLIIRKKPLKVVPPYVAPPMVRRVYHGDLFEILPTFDPGFLDACICDPPYGLEFMGKDWDNLSDVNGFRRQDNPADVGRENVFGRTSRTSPEYRTGAGRMQKWHEQWAEEVWRVLKPGGYLVAFGGTRTFHRLTCALEDAGFEIRDCLMWLYGTGFPKSLNVQQMINKDAAGYPQGTSDPTSPNHGKFKGGCTEESPNGQGFGAGAAAFMSEQGNGRGGDAGQWQGWGTALKPGWEPIILARKPLRGTVAENVLKHGTGGLNIDACRIDYQSDGDKASATPQGACTSKPGALAGGTQYTGTSSVTRPHPELKGRWPANVVLDEEAALQLDAQTGDLSSPWIGNAKGVGAKSGLMFGGTTPTAAVEKPEYADTGGASRFFYCAKPGRAERDLGCEALPVATGGEATDREDDTDGLNSPRAGAGRTGGSKNIHPTVKPLKLMQWLVKLVTPPGGIVLDPFLGSGTTAMACVKEGVGYVGIEREEAYVKIAEARIAACA